MKPTVALFMPPRLIRRMFREPDLARLQHAVNLVDPGMTDANLPVYASLENATVIITGWGTPPIDATVLNHASHVKLIAHSAGSVRNLIKEIAFDRGIRVTTAASANAIPVAEFTVAMIVSLLKQVPWIGPAYLRHDLEEVAQRKAHVRELADLNVGLIAASRVGRLVIQLLGSYHNLTIKLYDPFLSEKDAAELGVVKSSLEDVCKCNVISVHAPNLPETRHMISARMLALMPDHAVFINTSRGALVDESALLAELHTRPIYCALDVTDPEPLPIDSPLRSAPNLLITPHIAGAMNQARRNMGKLAIDETLRFLRGEPLQHEVTRTMLATQA